MSNLEAQALEAQLIGELLANWEQAKEEEVQDRRVQPRRTYPYVQSVAPMLEGETERPGAFQDVRCRDISGSGFSFLTREQPTYGHLVVAFGSPPNTLYMKAEVVHVTSHDEGGQPQYVVGCRYVGRMPANEVQSQQKGAAPIAAEPQQPLAAEAVTDFRPRRDD